MIIFLLSILTFEILLIFICVAASSNAIININKKMDLLDERISAKSLLAQILKPVATSANKPEEKRSRPLQ